MVGRFYFAHYPKGVSIQNREQLALAVFKVENGRCFFVSKQK